MERKSGRDHQSFDDEKLLKNHQQQQQPLDMKRKREVIFGEQDEGELLHVKPKKAAKRGVNCDDSDDESVRHHHHHHHNNNRYEHRDTYLNHSNLDTEDSDMEDEERQSEIEPRSLQESLLAMNSQYKRQKEGLGRQRLSPGTPNGNMTYSAAEMIDIETQPQRQIAPMPTPDPIADKMQDESETDGLIEYEPAEVESEMCVICQDSIKLNGDHRISALECGHMFGRKCIERWMQENSVCPVCKVNLPNKKIINLFPQQSLMTIVKQHYEDKVKNARLSGKKQVRAIKRDMQEMQKHFKTIKQMVEPIKPKGGAPTPNTELVLGAVQDYLSRHVPMPTTKYSQWPEEFSTDIKISNVYTSELTQPSNFFAFVGSPYTIALDSTSTGSILLFDLTKTEEISKSLIGEVHSLNVLDLKYHRPYSTIFALTNNNRMNMIDCRQKSNLRKRTIELPRDMSCRSFITETYNMVIMGGNRLIMYDFRKFNNAYAPIVQDYALDEQYVDATGVAVDKMHNVVMTLSNNTLGMFNTRLGIKPTCISIPSLSSRSLSPFIQFCPSMEQFSIHTMDRKDRTQFYHTFSVDSITRQKALTSTIDLPSIPKQASLDYHAASMKHSLYFGIDSTEVGYDGSHIYIDDTESHVEPYLMYPLHKKLYFCKHSTRSWVYGHSLSHTDPIHCVRSYSSNGAFVGTLSKRHFQLKSILSQ